MPSRGLAAAISLILAMLVLRLSAAPFAVFPKAGRLVSPDGRFEVRDADRAGSATEFVGTFHSLWLTELQTGKSRKLCDYVGISAVAWSSNDFLVVTQYLNKKTSRALVFLPASTEDSVTLDKSTLIRLIAPEFRATLRENDHVFIEASRLETEIFYFRAWGYGQHDPTGFRWDCEYALREGVVSCSGDTRSK